MKPVYKQKCFFCGSEDIRLPEIGISFGMSGNDYNFCNRCLFGMTADQFWEAMFDKEGVNYPPILSGWVADAIKNGQNPEDVIYPDTGIMLSKNKISAKKISERNKMTNSLRYDVMRRDNFYCVLCGATGKDSFLVVDHIEPISKGGKTVKDNLRTLCSKCNSGKAAK